jgi:hypothetical protein
LRFSPPPLEGFRRSRDQIDFAVDKIDGQCGQPIVHFASALQALRRLVPLVCGADA